jgi:diguanylate cyclase (GGDEF)-like protein
MTAPNDPAALGLSAPEAVAELQAALQRCLHERDEMARRLKAAFRELDTVRQALQAGLQREAELRQMVGHDALTGLPNRVAFGQRSSRTLAAHAQSKRCFGLLFVDLDGFKAVNDGLGHAAGDALLAVIGARLSHALRQGDFVSRHGGDEFVCLLSEVDEDKRALALAGKLMDVISAPCQIGHEAVRIRASIGVALFPRDGDSVATLLEKADDAMLWAKAQRIGIGLASRLPATRARATPVVAGASSTPMRDDAGRFSSARSFPTGQTPQPGRSP